MSIAIAGRLLLLRELRGVEILQIARDRLLDELAVDEHAHHEELLLLLPSPQRLNGRQAVRVARIALRLAELG